MSGIDKGPIIPVARRNVCGWWVREAHRHTEY